MHISARGPALQPLCQEARSDPSAGVTPPPPRLPALAKLQVCLGVAVSAWRTRCEADSSPAAAGCRADVHYAHRPPAGGHHRGARPRAAEVAARCSPDPGTSIFMWRPWAPGRGVSLAACLPRAGRKGDWKVTSHARPQREPGLEPAASFRRWLGPSCRADPQHPEDAAGCPGSVPRSPHWPERHSGPGRVPAAFTGSPSPSPAGVSADPLTRWAQSCLVERPEVAWCGLVWCGVARPGVAWPGVAWRGLACSRLRSRGRHRPRPGWARGRCFAA